MQEKSLVDILLEEKLVSASQVEEARCEQKSSGLPLQKILLNKGFVSGEDLARALAKQLDMPYIKLVDKNLDPQIVNLIPRDVAARLSAIPVKMEGGALYIAFASPLNLPAREEIRLITDYTIRPLVTTQSEIEEALNRYFKAEEVSKQTLIDMRFAKIKESGEEGGELAAGEDLALGEEVPVVRLSDDLIEGAISARASDVHLEPQFPEMVVRYRIDGILYDIMTVPRHAEPYLISRIKVLANMDITERRRPQDGHITMKKDNREYDLRVSTVLTVNGEKVVMRILDKSSMFLGLEKLGLTAHDEQILRTLIARPYGMLLVSGPTGSGKTTTLYAALSQLDAQAANIVTIEDPIEYRIDRISQIQVDSGVEMTFATGLRTILRQDPDIIMVGEIRDRETAEIAIQAALTGHLVLSTLHTNDAPSVVTRMIDMGVEPFLIASTLIGAIAQRLCRTICPKCKAEYTPGSAELAILNMEPAAAKDIKLAKGKGCNFCYNTGFRGRTAIYEIMTTSNEMRKLIMDKRPKVDITRLAVSQGMKSLAQNALEKVLDRSSTLEEIKRVVFVEK